MNPSIRAITPKAASVIVLNAFGIIAYLLVASRCWIEPELARIPGASGGAPVVWAFTALPILAFFVVLDLLLGLFAALAHFRHKKAALHAAWCLVPIGWAIAIYIDFAHHGS